MSGEQQDTSFALPLHWKNKNFHIEADQKFKPTT